MKKITLTVLTILILTLTACGSTSQTSSSPSPQSGLSTGELPAATQLMIGTLKLEGTGQAVSAEQAAALLPLWQTLQVLSDSDTSAEQEKEALITQIQESMTAEQMQVITDMNLTREDILAIVQQEGMGATQNSTSQSGNSSSTNNGGPGPGAGAFPDGAPPDGGVPGVGPGFGGEGQSLSPDEIATARASRQQNTGDFVLPMLINSLIDYLQKRASS